MLEVKGLKKVYKPKKGKEVNALDGVDLLFPEKGMIFILGKSGSGKSTLLNLLGGLDIYDDGEIIIKGKSSKEFSQSDFDSYRNTYLGFIFQEYNILDEFSVLANIALAIELQHDKATPERIEEILEQVDLVGFGNRKPRELSGGQKQRVAIARALVKNPDIILADEPTGALDSNTGIAVFDTLKQLSKDKLVIIVSHDREFAENYGDRVIEFKDGHIISDIVKYPVENKKLSEGVAIYDKQAIQIKKGHKLTQKDLENINKYIEESNEEVIISLNERTTTAAKVAARITEDGSSESFRDTKKEDILIKENDSFKLKKSRLGFKNSFKIGVSSLRVKPIRLMITILLSFTAYTLFGVADTMGSFDEVTTSVNTLLENDVNFSTVQKKVKNNDWYRSSNMTDTDLEKLAKDLDTDVIGLYSNDGFSTYYSNNLYDKNDAPYYSSNLNFLTSITLDDLDKFGFELEGRLPNDSTEIVVTEYVFSMFRDLGYNYYNENAMSYEKLDINSIQSLIGKNINISRDNDEDNNKKTIVGVLDTNFNEDDYEDFKKVDFDDYMAMYTFQDELKYGLHTTGFLHEDFFDYEVEEKLNLEGHFSYYINNQNVDLWAYECNVFDSQETNFFFDGKTVLNEGEILISFDSFNTIYNTEIQEWYNNFDVDPILQAYVDENGVPSEFWGDHTYFIEYWKNNFSNSFYGYPSVISLIIDQLVLEENLFIGSSTNFYDWYAQTDIEFNVVGIHFEENGSIMLSRADYDNFLASSTSGRYGSAVIMLPNNAQDLRKVVEYNFAEHDGVMYVLTTPLQNTLNMINEFIVIAAPIFMYIGIGFAIFASLLLYNFISISIAYKQREIGILRAIGARSKDVFGIFFSETLVIGFINFVLASVAIFVSCNLLNGFLDSEFGLPIVILNPNIRQLVLVFGVTLLVSFISSFLPVYKIAIKRPIESIRKG